MVSFPEVNLFYFKKRSADLFIYFFIYIFIYFIYLFIGDKCY